MKFKVFDSNGNVIGSVEADNIIDAWQKAREMYEATGSLVYDVVPDETEYVKLPLGFSTIIKGVIEGYDTEFNIILREEKDCSPEFWERMGQQRFYEVRLYDRYLGSGIEGYISADNLKSLLSRIKF